GGASLKKPWMVRVSRAWKGRLVSTTRSRANCGGGGEKREKARVGARSPPKSVEAPPVAVLALTEDPLVIIVGQAPHAFRLIWKNAGAADLRVQQAADCQDVVSDQFCVESKPRCAREQAIVGVLFQQRLAGL